MSECIVAIDPGASGGFCQFVDGKAVWAWKFTTFSDFVADILDLQENPDHSLEIVLEDVPPFAGKNIPSSTGFKLGKSCGFYEGVARGLQLPCHMVRPQAWQKGLANVAGQGGAKKKRILKDHALRLYPKLGKTVTLATADAVLIGHYHTTTTTHKHI
jgi:hypothetical protein